MKMFKMPQVLLFLGISSFLVSSLYINHVSSEFNVCESQFLTNPSIKDSQGLNRVRGILLASEANFTYNNLQIYSAPRIILRGISISNLFVEDALIINATNGEFYELKGDEISNFKINSSKIITVDLEVINTSINVKCINKWESGNLTGSSFEGNAGNFSFFSQNSYQATFATIQSSSALVEFKNGSNILINLEYNTKVSLIGNSRFSFLGQYHVYFSSETEINCHRKMESTKKLSYSTPSKLQLIDTFGNFSIGPKEYFTRGFDEVILFNSLKTNSYKTDFAFSIQYNNSLISNQFRITFGLGNWEAHITQLIINSEINYDAKLIFQKAPPKNVVFDESKGSRLELNFIIYNPTDFDIFNIIILFDNEFGGIFNTDINTNNKTYTSLRDSYSIEIDYFPAKTAMEGNIITESKFFTSQRTREGNILIYSENTDDILYNFKISYTNPFLELMDLFQNPIIISAIPIVLGLIGNIWKDELKGKIIKNAPKFSKEDYFYTILVVIIAWIGLSISFFCGFFSFGSSFLFLLLFLILTIIILVIKFIF